MDSVKTGIGLLDELTGGLPADGLSLLGARTGAGKTVLTLTIARSVARRGLGVLYVSYDETPESLVEQAVFAEAGVSRREHRETRDRLLGTHDYAGDDFALAADREALRGMDAALAEARTAVGTWPLFLESGFPPGTAGRLGLRGVREAAAVAAGDCVLKGTRLGLVIVDTLLLMATDLPQSYRQASDLAAGLAAMAAGSGLAVLATVQLHRGGEGVTPIWESAGLGTTALARLAMVLRSDGETGPGLTGRPAAIDVVKPGVGSVPVTLLGSLGTVEAR